MQIQAQVSPGMLSRLPRFFSNNLSSIINELVQNSRRAGATRVDIDYNEDNQLFTYRDNGCGIPDPQVLLNYGHSEWDNNTQANEDPAGMGFLCLGNREIYVASHDWEAELSPENFSGAKPAEVSTGLVMRQGIYLEFPYEFERFEYIDMVKRHVLYRPFGLDVYLNRELVPVEDFLQSCKDVEEWHGLRIGISHASSYSRLNFYGIVPKIDLPRVGGLTCYVDVVACERLRLVLPARNEVFENEFLEELRSFCLHKLYAHWARRTKHHLTYKEYQVGRNLGFGLIEAEAVLAPAEAPTVNSREISYPFLCPVTPEHRIFLASELELDAQAFGWLPTTFHYMQPNPEMEGYTWYDSIPTIKLDGFELTQPDGSKLYWGKYLMDARGEKVELTQPLDCQVIEAIWKITTPDTTSTPSQAQVETIKTGLPALVLVEDGYDSCCYGIWDYSAKDIAISLTQTPSHYDLEHQLKVCLFRPDDDGDTDETQEENFENEASRLVLSRLPDTKKTLESVVKAVDELSLYQLLRSSGIPAVSVVITEGIGVVYVEQTQSPIEWLDIQPGDQITVKENSTILTGEAVAFDPDQQGWELQTRMYSAPRVWATRDNTRYIHRPNPNSSNDD